jgi:hypothetical protein
MRPPLLLWAHVGVRGDFGSIPAFGRGGMMAGIGRTNCSGYNYRTLRILF